MDIKEEQKQNPEPQEPEKLQQSESAPSTVSASAEQTNEQAQVQQQQPTEEEDTTAQAALNTREQDRFLPIANIARVMKRASPEGAKINKDAKEAVQEAVSEFISFVTSEAVDKCHQEKRKTINGDDILWAMGTLGFDRYIDPLRIYLQKYRAVAKKSTNEPENPVEE